MPVSYVKRYLVNLSLPKQEQYMKRLCSLLLLVLLASCSKYLDDAFTIEVLTASVSSITANSATGGGTIKITGTGTVASRGVCRSGFHQTPTISDSTTSDGVGQGSYVSNIKGLSGLKTYYVRAYAKDSKNVTSYGSIVSFVTPQ